MLLPLFSFFKNSFLISQYPFISSYCFMDLYIFFSPFLWMYSYISEVFFTLHCLSGFLSSVCLLCPCLSYQRLLSNVCNIPQGSFILDSALPTKLDPVFRGIFKVIQQKGFPDDSDSKEPTCNVEDLGSIPGLGRSLGGGHGNALQYPCLENTHGQRSLAGYSPQRHKELDTTERLSTQHSKVI